MKSMKSIVHLIWVPFVACLLVPAQADPGLPIFDTHVHCNEDAAVAFTPEQIIELMKEAGVARVRLANGNAVCVFGACNSG